MHRKPQTEYRLDGTRIVSLDTFFDEFSRVVLPHQTWGRNLDAFNDVLRGGFGTPADGFTLVWCCSAVSKANLSFDETVRQLERRLARCHASHRGRILREIEEAQAGAGKTVFDWLIEIIRAHGPCGDEAHDEVHLVLA